MKRLIGLIGLSILVVLATASTPAAALTTTSFTLHGSIAGGVTQAHPGDVLVFSFVGKNTGATNVGASLQTRTITNLTADAVAVTECSFNGVAGSGDGQGFCEPGTWPHGQTVGAIISVTVGNTLGPATLKECVLVGSTFAPCVTLSIKVL
jgi:hypothetical protein